MTETHRGVICRVHPGSLANHIKMYQWTGACCWTHNETLGRVQIHYKLYRAGKADKPDRARYALSKLCELLGQETDWLPDCRIPSLPLPLRLPAWSACP